MNHTVVVDEEYRRFTNMFNALFRHCRIKNVVEKHRLPPMPIMAPTISSWAPSEPVISPLTWLQFVQYFGTEPRKCSCKPGQACGNVACPHLSIATC